MIFFLKDITAALPTSSQILEHEPSLATTIYDRNGKVITQLFQENRTWVKLDAGEQAAFERASGTKRPLGAILEGLLRLAQQRPVVVQSLFFRWQGRAPTDAELAAWHARLAELLASGARLARVQVYTVARRPASDEVSPLEPEALERIAAGARALGLDVEVFS